ncbi:negative cofactor 2 transcription regulator complex subunit ncb2 [Sorochytrium milnesiophthora]
MADDAATVDDELCLPRATVTKLVHEMLPPDMSIAKETRDLLIDCCTEFIHLVSSEANDICEKEARKTIAPEHVISALQALGFDSFVAEVKESWDEHRHSQKDREKRNKKLGMDDMTPEEALAAQQAMFEQARMRMQQQQQPSASSLASVDTKQEPGPPSASSD